MAKFLPVFRITLIRVVDCELPLPEQDKWFPYARCSIIGVRWSTDSDDGDELPMATIKFVSSDLKSRNNGLLPYPLSVDA